MLEGGNSMQEPITFFPKTILCPVDFSELSNLAIKYAAAGALTYGSKLTLLHAETFELPRYFSRSETDRLTREITQAKAMIQKDLADHVAKILGQEIKNLALEYEVVEASPIEAILHAADQKTAGLIVIGTHGLGGVKRVLIGSVAENVVHAAKIPTFIVRQKEHDFIDVTQVNSLPSIKRILCPCETNELGRKTLLHAVSLAEQFQSRLTVLYSHETPNADNLDRIKETLCNWISNAVVKTKCDLEPIVRIGDAADQIITTANGEKYDLIVAGAHHRLFHGATIFGRTTDLVVRYASVPVMIIPHLSDSLSHGKV
jgi:nucleotide-binding universal stress UspA family protein